LALALSARNQAVNTVNRRPAASCPIEVHEVFGDEQLLALREGMIGPNRKRRPPPAY
jgi:hypothetical protein